MQDVVNTTCVVRDNPSSAARCRGRSRAPKRGTARTATRRIDAAPHGSRRPHGLKFSTSPTVTVSDITVTVLIDDPDDSIETPRSAM